MTGPSYAIISSLAFSYPLLCSWDRVGLAGVGGAFVTAVCACVLLTV